MLPKPTSREPVYLLVPFAEKDDAKAAGAFWNPAARKWYVPPGTSLRKFVRWMSAQDRAPFEEEIRKDQEQKRRSDIWHSLEPRWTDPQKILAIVGQLPVYTTAFCVACDSRCCTWFIGREKPTVELRHMAELGGKVRPSEMRILEHALDNGLLGQKPR